MAENFPIKIITILYTKKVEFQHNKNTVLIPARPGVKLSEPHLNSRSELSMWRGQHIGDSSSLRYFACYHFLDNLHGKKTKFIAFDAQIR